MGARDLGRLGSAGKDFTRELNNLYVSPIIAEAVLKADPNFAPDLKQVRTLLKENFPQRDDISTNPSGRMFCRAMAPMSLSNAL